MNLVDLVVVAVAAFAAFRGWRRGLFGQALELGGGFIGLLVGVSLGPSVAGAFSNEPGLTSALVSILFVLITISIGQTIGFLIGHRMHISIERIQLSGLNSALGSAFGVMVWLVSFWLVGSLLVQGPSPALAQALKGSSVLRATNSLLPEPPNVLAYLRQYLNTSGFPQVFAGIPRVSEPVSLPNQRTANRAARAAAQSTVRIVLEACGGIQLGTGWVSDPDSVVTNAHVVAGGQDVTVQEPQGNDLSGRVVLYDSDTDIAVLHVPGLARPPLPLEAAAQERGTPGATVGYPGEDDGRQVAKPAAVQNSYNARGYDIYGRHVVSREVYELRSEVRKGDSGGPFVLPDGRVAGVVFAASTTEGQTGYALTGSEVQDEVRTGSARTDAVGTGSCTH